MGIVNCAHAPATNAIASNAGWLTGTPELADMSATGCGAPDNNRAPESAFGATRTPGLGAMVTNRDRRRSRACLPGRGGFLVLLDDAGSEAPAVADRDALVFGPRADPP